MTIVHVPRVHVCEGLSRPAGDGWWYPSRDATPRRWPAGTVRRCGCGRTWVAGDLPGLVPNIWRPERRRERRRRERAER